MNPIGVVLIIVLVGFPAWAGYVVYRRGRKGWAIATWLLIVTGWGGAIAAVFALYATAQDAVGRPLKEPCPECGRQEGSTIGATFNRKTGAWMRTLPAVLSGVLGLALAIGLAGMAVLTWMGGDDLGGDSGGMYLEWEHGAFIAGMGFLILGVGVGALLGRPALRFLATDRVRGLRSRCKACGHVWIDAAGVDIPPSVPGVHWLRCSDEYLWGRNSEKTSYFIFSRADLSEPLHTYPETEREVGRAQCKKLAPAWWPAVSRSGRHRGAHHSEPCAALTRRDSVYACPSCGRDATEAEEFCPGCGHMLPTTTAPAQRAGGPPIVATFGPATGWTGKTITFENEQFILEGHGPILAADAMEYDRLGQLDWAADAGLRAWVESVAAAEESHSAAPGVDHATSTSPRHDQMGEASLKLPVRGPVLPFEWLSPEERRWLIEGLADTRTDRTLPLLSMLAEDEDSAVAAAAVQAAARVRADPRRPSSSSKSGLLPVDEAAQAIRGGRGKHQLRSLGRCIGNPTEHNVSVLTLLSSGSDDAARQARKALELLALWSEATPTPSSAGGEMPPLLPQPAIVVATFGSTTGWVGKTIAYENQQFVLEGHGPTSAEGVLEYDRQGHLVWANLGLREWVQGIVASRQAASAAPPTTHDDRTQAIQSSDPVLPTMTAPAQQPDRASKGTRTRIAIGLCTVVVLAGAIAAILVLNQRHEHAEQVKRQFAALVGQAKAADKLGSELDSAATDYRNAVTGVESALLRNAAAAKVWKKTWAKRSAAYEKKVAAVKAYNNSPAGQRRWVPNVRTVYYETSRPGFLLYEEPSIPREDVWYADGFWCDGVYVDKIVTRRSSRPVGRPHKLPRHPNRPSKVKDPVRYGRDELADLKVRLGTLAAELDVAKLGPEFLTVADEIRNGIEVLRTKVALTLKACNEAVHRDPKIGYVAVPKKFKGVDVAGVHEAVQVVRESLVDAAQTHGVDLSELTWASTQP